MQAWKAKKLENEFPFLGKICSSYLGLPSLEEIDQVKVEVADSALLNWTGYHNYSKKDGQRKIDYNVFFIVVADGPYELKVVPLQFSRIWEDSDSGNKGKSSPVTTIEKQVLFSGYYCPLPEFIVDCEGEFEGNQWRRKLIIRKIKNIAPFAGIIEGGYKKSLTNDSCMALKSEFRGL